MWFRRMHLSTISTILQLCNIFSIFWKFNGLSWIIIKIFWLIVIFCKFLIWYIYKSIPSPTNFIILRKEYRILKKIKFLILNSVSLTILFSEQNINDNLRAGVFFWIIYYLALPQLKGNCFTKNWVNLRYYDLAFVILIQTKMEGNKPYSRKYILLESIQ